MPGGFQPELVAKLEESSKRLSKGRKKRVVSSSLATPEAIADFALLASQPLHKTSKVCLPYFTVHNMEHSTVRTHNNYRLLQTVSITLSLHCKTSIGSIGTSV